MGGAWTIRWGRPLWEASIAAGRASNASGSCSPERFRLVFSEVYFYGETSGESGESGAGPFLLVPFLDEPSFLRERKVSRGDGRRPGPSQCAVVGCSQLAARRGNGAVPVLICRQGSHFCHCREREAGPKAVQNARLFRGAPTLKGVGSAAYPCPLSDRSAPLRVLKALNGGFEQSPGLYCFPCGSAGKESACSAGDLGSIPGLGKIPWRRGRLPTPVFWRGEFHGLL